MSRSRLSGGPGLQKTLLRIAATAAIAGAASLALGAGPASAADWTYERVTPVDKDGGSIRNADTFRASPDGKALLYSATGSFNGVPAASSPQYVRYLAQRTETGWTNTAVDLPWDMGNFNITVMLTVGSSENLEWLVLTSTYALTPGAHAGGSNLYARNTRTGQLYLIATTPDRNDFEFWTSQGANFIKFVGNDGLVLFGTSSQAPDLMPIEAPGARAFRWTPAGGLEAIGRMPEADGDGYYAGGAGHSNTEQGVLNPIPPGAIDQRIYFTASGSGSNGPIYLVGDTGSDPMTPVTSDRTAANLGTMRPGYIAGTSEDGRYVVIQLTTSNQKLTDDTPTLPTSPRYIYRYDSVTDTFEMVGAASNTQFALSNSGVRWVSPDASTVIYQSTGVHAPGAVNGQPNLYVWREDEGIKWITTASVAYYQWRSASRNGRYFVFANNSETLAQQVGYNSLSTKCSTTAAPAPCQVVYRYDIEEDELECVSCRPDGSPPGGHHTPDGVAAQRMDFRLPQYVADDGTVFFDTPDPLVASDMNGQYDTYAWRDGEVRLVSRAAPGYKARFVDATPDGKTVFFATAEPIVPSDTDQSFDIYAARLDGGFVEEPDGLPNQCAGSDCRPPMTSPTLPVIGSVSFAGTGNVAEVSDQTRVSVRVSRLKSVSGSAARLRIQVPAAGRIRVGGRLVRSSGRTAAKAGIYRVAVRLKPRARKRLANKQRLAVQTRVVFRAQGGETATKVIRVTFNQPMGKRGKAKQKGGR